MTRAEVKMILRLGLQTGGNILGKVICREEFHDEIK
jgi:hypothetical protein